MLNRAVFVREMTLLHDRFGRTPNEHVIGRYYDTLKDRLSTEEFEQAARFVFDQDSFWPAPARFIELAQGNAKDDADREWVRLLDSCSRGDRNVLLSPEGAAAMRAVGGWNSVAYCSGDRALEDKRRAFARAFASHREERELLRLLPATAAALELEA
jgi:hypothetical protein